MILRRAGVQYFTSGGGHATFSVGSVLLRSRNPLDPPVIPLNLLADDRDQTRLLEAVKLANHVARTTPLSG